MAFIQLIEVTFDKKVIQKIQDMVANLVSTLVKYPELLKAYHKLHTLFTQTSFNAEDMTNNKSRSRLHMLRTCS